MNIKASSLLIVPFILSSLLVSCTRNEDKPTDLVTFPLKGEVVAIDTARKRLTVAHEEIPDYMMAMTMPFKVKDPELLRSVTIGDTIQGVLAVSRTESWLETFTVTGKGEAPSSTLVEGAILARILNEGDALPPVEFTNQDGKKIFLNNFKGRALTLTFIYTRCPLPDFCILMSNHFAKVQKSLSRDKALDGKWHLVTISFDPAFDTPRVLKSYGQSYRADFSTWDFITSDEASIRTLADGLGLTLSDDEGGLIAHNLRTVVLNKEGRIAKIIQGNEWKPEEVVDAVRKIVAE
jgi:protein SCO1/2